MGRYIVRRLIWVVFVLLVITFISYMIFFVMPSKDPAIIFAGRQPTPELVAEVRHQFGLDHPWPVQYALFVKRIFLGDQYGWPGLGFSFNTRSALKPIIISRLLVTMQLAFGAAVVWLLIGIPIPGFVPYVTIGSSESASIPLMSFMNNSAISVMS